MQTKEFLNNVCEQIKYKPIRNSISEELENHIEESKENYIEEGDGTNNNRKPSYIKEQNNYNCQQFFGNISNCTFTMPSSSKDTETAQKKTAQKKKRQTHTLKNNTG